MSTPIAHFEAPKDTPRGLLVFYAGNNGTAPDGENSTRYWDHWWEDALAEEYAVCSVESPGPDWSVEETYRGDLSEIEAALEIVAIIRSNYLQLPDLPTWHIGFSAGTGPASVNGYRDPNSRGFAMLCAAGRVQFATHYGGDRPIYIGVGMRDPIVKPQYTIGRAEEQWRPLVGDSLLVKRLKRRAHTPHPDFINSCFEHLGIA